jgi:ribose 5-phosphate isomerase A
MTIIERVLDMIPARALVGLGSGRAAQAFVRALGERVRAGAIQVRGVPTSEETAAIAAQVGVPLATLDEVGELDLTVDGADEVAPNLDLIKGYGRAMVREKIVARSSRQLVILVGQEKLVPQLGARGKLPVEVMPLGLALCTRLISALGCHPVPWTKDGHLLTTDNGNYILDCGVGLIADPVRLEKEIHAIPGVVGTGLFLGMADLVLVGNGENYTFVKELRRSI